MNKKSSLLMIWAGQIVSLFGSGLTGFALGVWLYQRTGSASNFALVALCTALPQMLLSPLAGVLVDRFNRRWMMALADSGSALCTLAAAVLYLSGHIQVAHIYLITALSSSFGALQAPAYAALVASVLSKEQLGRANGMIQLGQGLAEILAPALAGVLVALVRVPGVLLIDLATYLVGITTLLAARISAPAPVMEPSAHSAGLVSEALAGWRMVRGNPGLVALLRFQALFSFLWSLFAVLVTPMVLGFARPEGLGLALTVAGGGMLTGSLVMSVWGGPQRRLRGLLLFELGSAVGFVVMGARPSLALVAAGAFCAHFTLAFVTSLNDSIWQSQAPTEVRGRVFALKQAAVKGATLLAYLTAGALADRVINPLLMPGGALVSSLGRWIGTGPGRGIAALCILIGLVKAAAALGLGASSPAREAEAQIAPAALPHAH